MKHFKTVVLLLLGLAVIIAYETHVRQVYGEKQQEKLKFVLQVSQIKLENRILKIIHNLEKLTIFLLDSSKNNPLLFAAKCQEIIGKDLRFDQIHLFNSSRGSSMIYSSDTGEVTIDELSRIVDSRSRHSIRKAVELNEPTIQAPVNLPDGARSIVFRIPFFHENKYHGMITGKISVSELTRHVVNYLDLYNSSLKITSSENVSILGEEISLSSTETVSTKCCNVTWYLEAGYHESAETLPSVRRVTGAAAGVLFLLAIGFLCTVSTRFNSVLQKKLEEKEEALKKLKNKFVTEVQSSRETEQALVKSEERYRALFDNNPIQTIVVDNSCRIVMYNFARTKVEGRLPVIGELMYHDYAKYHEIDMFSELVKCIESGKQKEFPELRYRERFLRINISPFTEGAIITCIDITAMKKLFEQLQHSYKMEALGTLAGGIAHEFNNILGIILGNAELAIEEISELNPTRECLAEIQSATLRAKEVVRQLLSFSSRQNHKMKPVEIGEVVEETINTLIRASIPSSIDIYTSIQKNIPMVMADPSRIQQIIINLLGNSAQAMENEKGIIKVELQEVVLSFDREEEYSHINQGNYVMLAVHDNGRGIAEEIQKRIFEPYFSTQEFGQGTGMGLSIVHGIVKDHGAEIILKSSLQKGTVVKILFPQLIGHTPVT